MGLVLVALKTPWQQNSFVHRVDVGLATKRHRQIKLFVNDLQRFGDTCLAHRPSAYSQARPMSNWR